MSILTHGITIYILFCSFVFGTIFGSAMNCLSLRIVRHEKWGGKSRSKCMTCGHTLGAFDLIPVVSYVCLGGKCRYCKTKISPRYLIAEVILGLCFALLTFKTINDISVTYNSLYQYYLSAITIPEISFEAAYKLCLVSNISRLLVNLIFTTCLFSLSLCDIESFEIPDRFLIIPAIFRIVYVILFGSDNVIFGEGKGLFDFAAENALNTSKAWIQSSLTLADTLIVGVGIGALFLILSLFMDKILKKNSLGGGDIKLFAVVGLFLKPTVLLLAILLSCLIGLVPSVIAMKKAQNKILDETNNDESIENDSSDDIIPEGAFPFGPAIAAAAFICLCFGEQIINLYLKLVGLG